MLSKRNEHYSSLTTGPISHMQWKAMDKKILSTVSKARKSTPSFNGGREVKEN